mgnify:CR=1 FL=1
MAEAVDRRRLLQLGLLATLANAVVMALLSRAGVLNPWHIGIGAFVSGLLWSTELSTRRRMLAESAGVAAMPRAIALDAMTNATTRMLGPVFGGLAYQTLGLTGAFTVSAGGAVVAILLAARVRAPQRVQPFRIGTVTRGLAEGIAQGFDAIGIRTRLDYRRGATARLGSVAAGESDACVVSRLAMEHRTDLAELRAVDLRGVNYYRKDTVVVVSRADLDTSAPVKIGFDRG